MKKDEENVEQELGMDHANQNSHVEMAGEKRAKHITKTNHKQIMR